MRSGVPRICCEEGQNGKLGHGALTVDFSTDVILNSPCWSSLSYWRRICFAEDRCTGDCCFLQRFINAFILACSTVMCDLGVLSDVELTLHQLASQLASSCLYQLRRFRAVRKYVNRQVLTQFVDAFVISGLDYCHYILAGLPRCLIHQLQRVKNAAARLIFGLYPRDDVMPALQQLHWLRVYCRICYKLCLLMYSASRRHCPAYIDDMRQSVTTSIPTVMVSDLSYPQRTSYQEIVRNLGSVRSQFQKPHFQLISATLPTQNCSQTDVK